MTPEANVQCHVVQYCDWHKIPVYHIPNGGKRNRREAVNLKRQGVRAGVPDLCIPVPMGSYHGLYIELKVDKNKTTQNQDDWLELLNKNGYKAVVCYGFDEAKAEIDKYFNFERW